MKGWTIAMTFGAPCSIAAASDAVSNRPALAGSTSIRGAAYSNAGDRSTEGVDVVGGRERFCDPAITQLVVPGTDGGASAGDEHP